jgi:hypothetical protein
MPDDFDDARPKLDDALRVELENMGDAQVRLALGSGGYSWAASLDTRKLVIGWLADRDRAQREADRRRAIRATISGWITLIAAVVAAVTGVIPLLLH